MGKDFSKSKGLNSFKKVVDLNNSTKPVGEQSEVIEVKIDNIIENERNMYHVDDVEDIKELISQYGQLEPLITYKFDGKYKLISGHRRLKAMRELGFKKVKILITQKPENETDTLEYRQIISLNSGARKEDYFNLAEIVKTCYDICKKENKNDFLKETAIMMGISKSAVQRYAALNNVIEPFKNLVRNGIMGITKILDISGMSEEEQYKLYDLFEEYIIKNGGNINNGKNSEDAENIDVEYKITKSEVDKLIKNFKNRHSQLDIEQIGNITEMDRSLSDIDTRKKDINTQLISEKMEDVIKPDAKPVSVNMNITSEIEGTGDTTDIEIDLNSVDIAEGKNNIVSEPIAAKHVNEIPLDMSQERNMVAEDANINIDLIKRKLGDLVGHLNDLTKHLDDDKHISDKEYLKKVDKMIDTILNEVDNLN